MKATGRPLIVANKTRLMLKLAKAMPVTDRGGPYGRETLRLLRFLDNGLTDGGEVVSLTLRQLFTPQEDSRYLFLLEAESISGPY
jgi:hypothetical protein